MVVIIAKRVRGWQYNFNQCQPCVPVISENLSRCNLCNDCCNPTSAPLPRPLFSMSYRTAENQLEPPKAPSREATKSPADPKHITFCLSNKLDCRFNIVPGAIMSLLFDWWRWTNQEQRRYQPRRRCHENPHKERPTTNQKSKSTHPKL